MASPAQIAANQQNALKSTGPKTEVGRAASSQNATTHGLTAAVSNPTRSHKHFSFMNEEDPQQLKELEESLIADFQPETTVELLLIGQMSEYTCLRSRALFLQSACIPNDDRHIPSDVQAPFSLYLRYEAQSQRGFVKALNELQKIRALRVKEEAAKAAQDRQKQLDEATAKRAEVKDRRAVEVEAMQKERHYIALATKYLQDENDESETPAAGREVRDARQNR